MKKQYMDFVPSAKEADAPKKPVKKKTVVMPDAKPRARRVVSRAASGAATRTAAKKPVRQATRTAKPAAQQVARVTKPVAKTVSRPASGAAAKTAKTTKPVAFSGEKRPKLGMVEDLNPKFVKTDVPKRPLSSRAEASHFKTEKPELMTAKAKKVGNRANTRTNSKKSAKTGVKPVENSVENSKNSSAQATYQPPKNPFINQGKVEKRPLSKNVYAKRTPLPKEILEEPKGPVTIISKPEKDANVGLIVAVILTIILGAAAGTVAFLLLPK